MRHLASPAAILVLALALLAAPATGAAAGAAPAAGKAAGATADAFAGLALRGIGPALTSGRIGDIAVDPTNPSRWFVAVASGGVWRTENAGTTWKPVFDREGSYSIGTVAIDPRDPWTVWVGTGENNSQRSVGYGDGVYLSEDGGESWKRVGLEKSEHIGKIVLDPRDSRVVYVAAQGPLWGPGGDRGLYKTTDRGATWKQVLAIGENTGVSDLVYDPRDPDVLYAAAYQRRRHVWTLVNGGPESAIYKSTDAGATWKKLESGLPKGDLGRIGLALSPVDPDVLFAIVEASEKKGGIFRSRDRGATWEKRSDYVSASPQYYNELVPDPFDADRLYSMDVFLQVSDDGGTTWRNLGERHKHVDNHAMWIDPRDRNHYLVGSDGGLYESFDRGATWKYFPNLPVTQFYRVAVDDSRPVYYVYGGTQDNFTLGGPSRSLTLNGVPSSDWFVTQTGDGFWAAIDPEDPNIVYSEAQHGVLTRYDRRSGENLDIQPQPGPGEPGLRWNWDAPLVLSPHRHTRLYFGANILFRSDDRGDSWRAISGDLTRQIDRNQLPVMGKVQRAEAVAKNASTSLYGNLVALDESPLVEGLLYAGADDGLVSITEDGGATWRQVGAFPGVPANTYVSDLLASRHDDRTVYAAFNNHKMADFKPYLLKSADRGRTWSSIAGDLPARGSVYTVAEDHVDRNLLFAGTEFGLFFTRDGGQRWIQLRGGMPVIAVRDIAIQRRENDLVAATFGRGFYILDDYTPLRHAAPERLAEEASLFPVRRAPAYAPGSPIGGKGNGFLGETHFHAPDPPFGAVFTYHLAEKLQTRKERRQEAEVKAEKEGKTPPYPTFDELRTEAREEAPAIVLTVADAEGNVVRRLSGPVEAGFHRVAWDLRLAPMEPAGTRRSEEESLWGPAFTVAPLAVPGSYTVSLAKRVDGQLTPLGGPETFAVEPLNLATLGAEDRVAVSAFQARTARLQRALLGAVALARETGKRLELVREALDGAPAAGEELRTEARNLALRLAAVETALTGDREMRRRHENDAPSIRERVQGVVEGHWFATQAPTRTHLDAYEIASQSFDRELAALRQLVEVDLAALERRMEEVHAPYTPGRVPVWQPE